MNYGVPGATIIPGPMDSTLLSDCRYEQLLKSLPNFVFMTFGAMDMHLKGFTTEKFTNAYVNMIQKVQNLPTRPMVFLMVPVSTCQNHLKIN